MKYKVKNTVTGEETICEKVVVDGEDYYTQNTHINPKEYYLEKSNKGWIVCRLELGKCDSDDIKVIATTNKSLDLPMVIDEVEELAEIDTDKCLCYKYPNSDNGYYDHIEGFKAGYKQAKETYSYTKEDMVEFTEWLIIKSFREGTSDFTTTELLDIWQEQRTIEISVE